MNSDTRARVARLSSAQRRMVASWAGLGAFFEADAARRRMILGPLGDLAAPSGYTPGWYRLTDLGLAVSSALAEGGAT